VVLFHRPAAGLDRRPPSPRSNIIESDPDLVARPAGQGAVCSPPPSAWRRHQSAITPVVAGEARAALDASRALEEQGFAVVAIRPPTVPGRHGAPAHRPFTAGA